MFGYIQPDVPHLYVKDVMLYKAAYCGLCKSIKKGCGQCARLGLTYDCTFLSVMLHNLMGVDMKINNERCILHPVLKRPVAEPDEISVLVGYVNTALTYYKLSDDIRDRGGKGALRVLFEAGKKRVEKAHPQVIDLVEKMAIEQERIERSACAIPDMAAEPFAEMMRSLAKYLLGEKSTPAAEQLFYDVGKWIYLIDAVDDYGKDVKKKNYNVYYNACTRQDKKEFMAAMADDLNFTFSYLISDMAACLKALKFSFNTDLTDNIVLKGIPLCTKQIFQGNKPTDLSKLKVVE